MAPTQAQKNYIRDEIQNASPQKLIVMLYDKAIKSLEEAKKNIQNENQFYFADNIIKAEKNYR
jgi:flagellar biosynthetic protein FliS